MNADNANEFAAFAPLGPAAGDNELLVALEAELLRLRGEIWTAMLEGRPQVLIARLRRQEVRVGAMRSTARRLK